MKDELLELRRDLHHLAFNARTCLPEEFAMHWTPAQIYGDVLPRRSNARRDWMRHLADSPYMKSLQVALNRADPWQSTWRTIQARKDHKCENGCLIYEYEHYVSYNAKEWSGACRYCLFCGAGILYHVLPLIPDRRDEFLQETIAMARAAKAGRDLRR